MISFIRRGTFYGGIFLPAAKSTTEHQPIRSLPLPGRLRVPISKGATPAVQTKDVVRSGQCLATCETGYGDTFSPADGRVVGQTVVDTACATDVPALEIEIRDAGISAPSPSDALQVDWEWLTDREVSRALRRCGVVGQTPAGGLAAERIDRARRHSVQHLIVNGMESEPCLTADHRVLIEHSKLVVDAVARLHRFLGVRRSYIAVDIAAKNVLRRLSELARRTPVRIVGLHNRYPVGLAPLLLQAILGREVAAGKDTIDMGVIMLNVGTVFHLARALLHSTPQTARIITVTGESIERPGNYWIPNGTTARHVLECVGLKSDPARVVIGGPMMGKALPHLDVALTLRCPALLALSSTAASRERPSACVHCGWCAEVCPMRLEPAVLLQAIELEQHDLARRLHPEACVECGLCSYVCPSSLPLASNIAREIRQLRDE